MDAIASPNKAQRFSDRYAISDTIHNPQSQTDAEINHDLMSEILFTEVTHLPFL